MQDFRDFSADKCHAGFSQADLVLQPSLERFALAMPEFAGYDLRRALGGALAVWLDAMADRPSCHIASPDPELFLAAMRCEVQLCGADGSRVTNVHVCLDWMAC